MPPIHSEPARPALASRHSHAATWLAGRGGRRNPPNGSARPPLSAATLGRNKNPIPAVDDRDWRIDQYPAAKVTMHMTKLTRRPARRVRTTRPIHTTA